MDALWRNHRSRPNVSSPVRGLVLFALALVLLAGCQPAAASVAPTTPGGIESLVADLGAIGSNVRTGSTFASEPIGGQGTTVCAGTETIRVYEFIDHEAALAAANTIDRDDPTMIGNGIVDWAGRPRFWLRDRIIVLYLDEDLATDAALRALLGDPFAEGNQGRLPLPGPPCQ